MYYILLQVKYVLKKFDETFAEFELSYVSTMVPVKSARDYDTQQDVIVLFCETLNRYDTALLLFIHCFLSNNKYSMQKN